MNIPQKTVLPWDLMISLHGTYPNEYKARCNIYTCMPMLIVVLVTIAKFGSSLDTLKLKNEIRKYCISIYWYIIQS
jgi:hypothetical protein